ncbi:hypothetical protein HPB51_023503 [Rhipicephalus microplus]|uniref:Uncharacterized protein n=1 Tax=Rhipicephalus microplus TaxID=6941 RepID=A0A9J6EJT5_RHIMP|nr:hypothetical protein HPB51_023503 [Rhipicephalus microplus]
MALGPPSRCAVTAFRAAGGRCGGSAVCAHEAVRPLRRVGRPKGPRVGRAGHSRATGAPTSDTRQALLRNVVLSAHSGYDATHVSPVRACEPPDTPCVQHGESADDDDDRAFWVRKEIIRVTGTSMLSPARHNAPRERNSDGGLWGISTLHFVRARPRVSLCIAEAPATLARFLAATTGCASELGGRRRHTQLACASGRASA